MKKIIIAAVVLGAALVGLKFFASKQQQAAPLLPGAPQQQAPSEGVALPESATSYSMPAVDSSAYAPSQSSGSYDLLRLPEGVVGLKGSCEGGAPKDIIADHGKIWGYFTGRRVAFDSKKTQEIYGYFSNYYACLSVARQDISFCGDLPGEAERDGVKIAVGESPLSACRAAAGLFLFKAYVAGKSKESSSCMGYLSDWDAANLARISPPDFCAAAAKGPEAIMAYTKQKLPDMYSGAERLMGFSRAACGSDQFCLANNDLWEGIRTGRADKCPPSMAPFCAALVQKSQAPCSNIVSELSGKYCAYRSALMKSAGGYAGYTADEVKDVLREQAQKKAEEERMRKEQDTVTKQVNERVRKLVGNQRGE